MNLPLASKITREMKTKTIELLFFMNLERKRETDINDREIDGVHITKDKEFIGMIKTSFLTPLNNK